MEEPDAPEETDLSEDIDIQPQDNASENLADEKIITDNMTISEKFAQDKVGNSLSVLVLGGMILVVASSGKSFFASPKRNTKWPVWIAPILIAIGLFVAIYMGYIEITQTEAICGPVGDCNTVQQSQFAYLFGIIPIGTLGVVGYLVIALAWLLGFFGPKEGRKQSLFVLFILTFIGTIFSIYLTFLEPFVIGATCAWCLTSAVVMTLLLVFSQGHMFEIEDI